jgi:glyoxylate/hydroxypyruvate reductase A
MTLLFACRDGDGADWAAALHADMPELDVRVWPETGDPDDISYALVWGELAAELPRFANLEIIFSLGAGVEHLLERDDLPAGVPVVRLVDPALCAGMVEFALMRVLQYHRRMPDYAAQQRARQWRELAQTLPDERRIGIMGLGELGGAVAGALAGLGFDVAGWTRSRRTMAGVTCYAGPDDLDRFLNRTEILLCLLPLTPDTADILNADLFAALPHGAAVINLARGGHVVDDDLIAALDSGHLSGAALDVFRTEPLPPDHPFWTHERIAVTPHIAVWSLPRTAAGMVCDNIRRHRAGEPLRHAVDRARGY